jgi:zinc/manganese transport system substrate-binding protein
MAFNKMSVFRKLIPIFISLALSLTACTPTAPSAAPPAGKLRVVATFSVLGDLVQNVGGDKIELRVLVGADSDAHTFEPSPADSVALLNASMIVENGVEFEGWLDDLYASSGSTATRVVVTHGIELRQADEHEDPQEGGHAEGEFDPHVWQDVKNAIVMVNNIRDALVKADSANASTYQANAANYAAQLDQLDKFIIDRVNSLPEVRRKLVTTHDSLGYFAKRYGLTVLGETLVPVSTEAADPSAGEIAKLVEAIKAAGVPAIFVENVSNIDLMQRIAAEAGVALGPELYTDALGRPGTDGDTYIKMMRHNATAIVSALSQ